MQVVEIVTAFEHQNQDLTQYLTSFMRGEQTTLGSINGLIHRQNEDEDHIYFGLFDEDEVPEKKLKAYLSVIKTTPYPRIGFIAVSKDYRNQGYMRKLIDWFVQNIGPLISDNAQTADAKAMWLALINVPGNLNLYRYNIDKQIKSKTKIRIRDGKPYPNPWNDSLEYVILAEDRNSREDRFLKEETEFRKRFGRPLIWYGILGGDGLWMNP